MNIYRFAYTLFIVFTVFTGANAQAPNVGISVIRDAYASIQDENISSAREIALKSALRGAIEEIMERMISANYQEKYAPLIEQHIFRNLLKYIIKYEVLEESALHEQSYAVSVKALIDHDKLERDLDMINVLQNRLSSPKIVLVIGERLPEKTLMRDLKTAEKIIRRELKKSGFFIVNADVIHSYGSDIAEAIAIGTELGGDIVVFGNSEATLREEADKKKSKMKNISASIELKAIKLDNGILISQSSAAAVYNHSNLETATERAIGKASVLVVKKLSEDIASRWKTEVNAGREVILSVSHITNITQFNSVKDSLINYLTGYVEVESRSYDGNKAEYSVTASTTGYQIASQLEGKKYEEFNFKILSSGLHALSVALVRQ